MECDIKYENISSEQEESRSRGKIVTQHGEKKITKNWMQRLKFGLLIFAAFCYILYQGSLALSATILLVQVMCYKEIINIVYKMNSTPQLPRLRTTVVVFFFHLELLSTRRDLWCKL
ncbi:hypothetical protein WA026_000831 [Henosepilachna vigintioctopunctata]|uniref:phosphatidate cytidylyltransferase n=1 Tax=Henosepilachna vigintioctopunctata TaxID=420089 RepID=A0AAW1UYW9_9CUCU